MKDSERQKSHPERQEWEDGKLLLTVERSDYTAYCSPEAKGDVYVDGLRLEVDTRNKYDVTLDRRDAPFSFDIVFHERYPRPGEVEKVADKVAEIFDTKFQARCEHILNEVDGLEGVLELEPEDINWPE